MLSKMIGLLSKGWFWQAILWPLVVWGLLLLACWILGGIALYRKAKEQKIRGGWLAVLPGGQVWLTLKSAHLERLAARVASLIWWEFVFLAAGGVSLVWAANFYLKGSGEAWIPVLLILAVILLIVAVMLYIGMRMLEFQALGKHLKKWQCAIALFFTLLAIPMQRIFLFIKKK